MNTIETRARRTDRRRRDRANSIVTARARLAGAAVVATALLGASGTAWSARYGVRVVDDVGRPVAGAAVCIGLSGNYRQFGAAFTDVDGLVELVDVPNVPLVVTVSKTRFAGMRRIEPARGYDVIRELRLVDGLPGPRCRAGSTMVANPPDIDVRDVAVIEQGPGTTLRPRVTGEPSEYRVALDEGFFGADWQRFDATIELPAALVDAPSVALQLRRYAGDERAWVEARSDIVTVQLPRGGRSDEGG